MMIKTKKLTILIFFTIAFSLILCGSVTAADPSNSTLSTDQSINTQNTTGYPDPQIIRGGTSTGTVYPTIQAAINNAQTGDTIRLDNGATFYEHDLTIPDGITSMTFDVWNASHTGPGGQATINAGGNGRIIYIPPGVTVNFNNITFTNGKASDYGGGAIYNYAGSCTVTGCTFTGNQASDYGGAIHNDSGSCTVTGCTFTGNQADQGGAISNWYGNSCTVTGSIFTGNQATYEGGAIYSYNCGFTITSCTFTGNQALVGGGIFTFNGNGCTITGCTFTNNIAHSNGGAISEELGSFTVTGCTFTGNQATYEGGAIFIDSYSNSIIQFNRISSNKHPDVYSNVMGCDAKNNWWGTNFEGTTPLAAGRVNDTVDASSWVKLGISDSSDLIGTGETSIVSVNLNHNTADEDLKTKYGKSVPDAEVTFSSSAGNVNPSNQTINNGLDTTTNFTASSPSINAVTAIVDGQSLSAVKVMNRNELYVATAASGGSDINGNGSQSYPFLTINKAMTELNPNGTIHIANGTYSGAGQNVGLTITKNMNITGESQSGTIIDAQTQGRIFEINSNVIVNINNLTLQNCHESNGGAIQNDGTLTVTGSTFINNDAALGGAIMNWGTLTVTGSTFTNNDAGAFGGAIFNSQNLTVNGSIFTYNTAYMRGGAIYNDGTPSIINGSTFTQNTVTEDGGGAIYNESGTLTVNGSTFTQNTVNWNGGGAIYNESGTLTVNGSTFTQNTANRNGDAIFNNAGSAQVHFNRFYDSSANEIHSEDGTVDATLNWWGSNSSPAGYVSTGAGGTVLYDPWIILTVSADPGMISPVGGISTVTADLLHDRNHQTPTGGQIPDGVHVTFSLNPNWGSITNVNPVSSTTSNGKVTATYNANGLMLYPHSVQIYAHADFENNAFTTINLINQAPTLDSLVNQVIDENKPLTFTLVGHDPEGDTLTYSAIGLPAGANFDPNNGVFSWTPNYDQSGAYPVTFSVTDTGGLFDSKTINILVNNVNRPPVLISPGDKSVNENQLLTFTLTGSDPDAGDVLTYSATGLPAGANLDPNTGVFSWTPSFSQSGTYPVTFTVTDTGGLQVSQNVNILVNNVNRVPTLNSVGDKVVNENQLLSFTLAGSDPDVGDVLAYSATGLPLGAVLDPNSGVFSWTPSFSQSGTYLVTFTVTDTGGLSDTKTANINVNNVNQAPLLNPIGDKSVNENQLLSFTLVGSDPDAGDTLTYSVTGLPSGATLNSNTGVFSWTPNYDQSGTYPVTFIVTDAGGLKASQTVNIRVNNVNRTPALNSVGDKVVNENQLLSFTLVGSDPDIGDVLTYSVTGLPSGATLNPNTGVFSWTPSFSQSGTYHLTFTVTDTGALSNSKTVTITVNNVNIADLQVKVVSSDSLPAVDRKFAFIVYIKNNGPNDATNVTVNVPIPAGLTYNYYISTQGTYNGSVWTLGKIKSGSRVFLYICATPQTAYLDRSITLTATPTLKEYDPTPVPGSTTIKISRISRMALVLFSVFMLYEIFQG